MRKFSIESSACLLLWCRQQLFRIGFVWGNWCIEKSKYTIAMLVFKQLVLLNPSDAKGLNGLGHIYFCRGQMAEALDSFQKAVLANPTLTLAYQNLGYVYSDLEHYTEAISAFQKAIRLEPENARPYHGLGLVYAVCGNLTLAKQCFEHSIRLDSLYIGPRISLAGIYKYLEQETNYFTQIEYLTTHMENQKNYTKARFYALCDDWNEALYWLEKVIAETPGYRWTIRHATDFVSLHDDPRFRKMIV